MVSSRICKPAGGEKKTRVATGDRTHEPMYMYYRAGIFFLEVIIFVKS